MASKKKPPLLASDIHAVAIGIRAANLRAMSAPMAGSKQDAVDVMLACADDVEKLLNDFEALCLERELPEDHEADWEAFSAPHRQAVARVREMMSGLEVR